MAYWRREQRDDGRMSKALERIALESVDLDRPIVFMLGGAEAGDADEIKDQQKMRSGHNFVRSGMEHSIAFVENLLGGPKRDALYPPLREPVQVVGVTYPGNFIRRSAHVDAYLWHQRHQYEPEAVQIADTILLPLLRSGKVEDLEKLNNITFVSHSYGAHVASDIASYITEKLKASGTPEWKIRQQLRLVHSIELSGPFDLESERAPRFNTIRFHFFDDQMFDAIRVGLPYNRQRDTLQISQESYGLWVTMPIPNRLHYRWQEIAADGRNTEVTDTTLAPRELERQHQSIFRNHSKCFFMCENIAEDFYARPLLERMVRHSIQREDMVDDTRDLVLTSLKNWPDITDPARERAITLRAAKALMLGDRKSSIQQSLDTSDGVLGTAARRFERSLPDTQRQ